MILVVQSLLMKKISILSLFMLLMTSSTLSFAQSSTSETLTDATTQALQGVQSLKSGIDQITQELFALDDAERAKNPNLDAKYREARDEIVRVINSINVTTEKITSSIQKLSTYQSQMQAGMEELQELRASSSNAKNYLANYLTLIYKMQLETYGDDHQTPDTLKLLTQSNNITQTLVGLDMTSALTAQLSNIINQTDNAESNNVALLKDLGKLKQEAQTTLTMYRDEIEKLQQKKQYLLSFIEMYKNKQTENAAIMDQIFASKRDVYLSIHSFLDEIVKKNYKSVDGISEKIWALANLPDARNSDTMADLAWPVYPIEQIARYYHDSSFEQENGFPFEAIQIQAKQRTPVHAARDGVVYHVFDNLDSISWIMIVHQDGYVTTYQYLNQILVKPWDVVMRGEIIGYSWWEPGTQGAGFVSEGENLTFGAFRYGLAIDPLSVLDLSAITDRETALPTEYRLKYLSDELTRPIDVSTLKFAEGDTVDERSQNFLNSYAKGVYRDLYFRDAVVEWTNIDRDMVICIAFAESTLGNYLSTSNNIGNVGNNDRGDRVAYGTPYEGARLIPLTLNNGYLGDYHTINQLSRYGNADGKIYASSPINWQTNVLKCLSKIKWYTVPEDFPFRTGPNPNKVAN